VDLASIVRAARAAVFAVVCVVLTVAGHCVAAGHSVAAAHPVAPTALGAGFVAVFGAGLAGGRRERSQSAITLGVYAGQLGLHLLFSVGDRFDTAGVKATAAAAAMGHMGDMGMAATSMSGGYMPGVAAHSGLAMLLAHLGAGTVAGWWLRGGEAACWRLLRRVESAATAAVRAAARRILAGPGLAPVPHLGRLCPDVVHRPGSAMSVRLARCSPRRGPPAGTVHLPLAH